MNEIRIGTRGSKLALWQANYVAEKLIKGGWNPVVKTIETKGDKILDVSLSKIGSKGLFTEEIENMLREGAIDIAVHSAKDLQSHLDEDLEIIAITERENPSDVLVSHKKVSLQDNIIVGTSSTRRVGLLKHLYPKVDIVPMRGNLQTRFNKMESGACDAMILAAAGVIRMGYESKIVEYLDTDQFIPPTGQGAVAVEASIHLDGKISDAVRDLVNEVRTEKIIAVERDYLRILNGGCSIPVYAHAKYEKDNRILVRGGICSLDGSQVIIEELSDDDNSSEKLGIALAELVKSKGADKLLKKIRKQLKNS